MRASSLQREETQWVFWCKRYYTSIQFNEIWTVQRRWCVLRSSFRTMTAIVPAECGGSYEFRFTWTETFSWATFTLPPNYFNAQTFHHTKCLCALQVIGGGEYEARGQKHWQYRGVPCKVPCYVSPCPVAESKILISPFYPLYCEDILSNHASAASLYLCFYLYYTHYLLLA